MTGPDLLAHVGQVRFSGRGDFGDSVSACVLAVRVFRSLPHWWLARLGCKRLSLWPFSPPSRFGGVKGH